MRLLKTNFIYLLKVYIVIFTILLNFNFISEVSALNLIDGHNFVSDAKYLIYGI